MAKDDKRPIVVKRIKKVAGGHHGGAWKIAYADFVTAMMAFFLLMWLLGSTGKHDLESIAEYFQMPLQVALQGGASVGNSSSLIKGGGSDLTKSQGQVKKGETPPEKKPPTKQEILKAQRAQEAEQLKALKASIEQAIDSNEKLKQFKNQILLDITSEGLRIQIVDEKNRPMFQSGRAQLESYTKEILHQIGQTLNEVPNRISLSGHTDAHTYGMGDKGYSNWELSADRANASRRELVSGGLAEEKMVRVVGLSSAVPFDKENPDNPVNRRISIIVMNKEAEERAMHDGGDVKVDAGADSSEVDETIEKGAAALPTVPAKH